MGVALIDRQGVAGSLGSQGHRMPRGKQAMLAVFVVSASLLSAAFSLLSWTESDSSESPMPAQIVYATHPPIVIEGDAGFLGVNSSTGITSGSGTEPDPYVIEGWALSEVDSYYRTCIWVSAANVHFVIQDCVIYNANGAFEYGIYFDSCTNGTIRDNVFYNNNYSIWLEAGYSDERFSDNRVLGNTFTDNNYGIMASHVCGLDISNNTCCDNTIGMVISWSAYSRVADNTCTDNSCGIAIWISNNTDVTGNDCSLNVGTGLHIFKATENNFSRNTCSSNSIGMWFVDADWEGGSSDNLVQSNWIEGNTAYGIQMDAGNHDNLIWNNSFVGNNGTGAVYSPEDVQVIDNGTANWWNTTDGRGNYWSDWTSPDLNLDDVVDSPYCVAGSAGAMDYYPIASAPDAIPEFSSGLVIVLTVTVIIAVMVVSRRFRAAR